MSDAYGSYSWDRGIALVGSIGRSSNECDISISLVFGKEIICYKPCNRIVLISYILLKEN